MKTTNVIILVGVLGLGGVGAYMYMKNKQAQDALLAGSLPATNQGGATTPSGTTTQTGGSTTTTPTGGSTTPNLSTQSDGVSPSDANLNLANATVLVGERALALKASKNSCFGSSSIPSGGGLGIGGFMSSSASRAECYGARELAKKKVVELDAKLAKLGYKVDATGTLVKI
jgi:hypothetical protein